MNKEKIIKYGIPVLLILVIILISSSMRMQSLDLPITDEWAEQSIEQQIKSNMAKVVDRDNPFLDDYTRSQQIQKKTDEFIADNQGKFNNDKEQLSLQLKREMQDDSGQTYLLAIDPYLWYGYALNYQECGYAGCTINEAGERVTLRNGRQGRVRDMSGVPALGIFLFTIADFVGSPSLLQVMFLIPVIMIALAIVIAFVIGKKFAGNIGGTVAGLVIALNGALLARTPAGFSDTDASNILFPLLIMWCFIMAYESKDNWAKRVIFGLLGAVSFLFYGMFWSTEHIFGLLAVASIMYLVVQFVVMSIDNSFKKRFKDWTTDFNNLSLFGLWSLVALVMVNGFNYITHGIEKIIGFVTIKDVGTTSLFPNVFTTVAEFNTVPFKNLIGQLGGYIFVAFAIIGIIALALKKNEEGERNYLYPIMLAVMVAGTAYSFTKGARFSLLVIPSFAIAMGAGVGLTCKWLDKKMAKWLAFEPSNFLFMTASIAVIVLLFIPSYTQANSIMMNEVPSYNDDWDNVIDNIIYDAGNETAYITTWWDFGHWFVSKGASVTFDGGDQGKRIHWVGKLLSTNNEDEAVGLLRALNCGQQTGFDNLEILLGDTLMAEKVFNDIITVDRETAEEAFAMNGIDKELASNVLNYTHCEDTMPQYVILSEDMVGKAGVWSHFGMWTLERAFIYQTLKDKPKESSVQYLINSIDIDRRDAEKYWHQVESTEADQWISEWAGFYDAGQPCSIDDEDRSMLYCDNGVVFDMQNSIVSLQTSTGLQLVESISFIDAEQEFHMIEQDNASLDLAIIIGRDLKAVIAQPPLGDSMFTRLFYFGGEGLEHFELMEEVQQFTGQKIQTWKVTFNE